MASVVTSLPESLSPWSEWLTWFAPELAAEIGLLLQRLQPLLGPFKGQDQGGEPEWQGLDDLRTRGPYERLLATEWLLADEMPDEFLRRAVSGEHIFLAPRPSKRRSQRTVIALFDAGPLQFGAPRLGHIALWILLARRAVQVQGEMRWGVLQEPGELLGASEVQLLKALLARRSFTMADASHVEQWQVALDAAGQSNSERWLIGSPYSNVSAAAFTHRVHFNKALDGQALEASLSERGVARKVSLPLPKQDTAVALLRGSFGAALPGERTIATESNAVALQRPPIISYDGSRVGVALRDEPAASVIYIPQSQSEQQRVPRLHRWSFGYSALAAVLVGKGLGVFISDPRRLRFWPTSMVLQPGPSQEQFHAPGSTAAWLPAAWLRGSAGHRVCVIDHSQRLMRWDAAFNDTRELTAEPSMQLVSSDAFALTQLSKELAAFAYYKDGRMWFARIGAQHEPHGHRLMCEAPVDTEVLLGRGCFWAVRLSSETWRIGNWNDASQSYEARMPDDLRVVGVLRDQPGRIGLLTLDGYNLRFWHIDGSSALLYTAPARVVSHSVCPNSGLVAMMTIDRQLIAFSAATRELRLCLQTGRGNHASA